jgi:hypothetical protein
MVEVEVYLEVEQTRQNASHFVASFPYTLYEKTSDSTER